MQVVKLKRSVSGFLRFDLDITERFRGLNGQGSYRSLEADISYMEQEGFARVCTRPLGAEEKETIEAEPFFPGRRHTMIFPHLTSYASDRDNLDFDQELSSHEQSAIDQLVPIGKFSFDIDLDSHSLYLQESAFDALYEGAGSASQISFTASAASTTLLQSAVYDDRRYPLFTGFSVYVLALIFSEPPLRRR